MVVIDLLGRKMLSFRLYQCNPHSTLSRPVSKALGRRVQKCTWRMVHDHWLILELIHRQMRVDDAEEFTVELCPIA